MKLQLFIIRLSIQGNGRRSDTVCNLIINRKNFPPSRRKPFYTSTHIYQPDTTTDTKLIGYFDDKAAGINGGHFSLQQNTFLDCLRGEVGWIFLIIWQKFIEKFVGKNRRKCDSYGQKLYCIWLDKIRNFMLNKVRKFCENFKKYRMWVSIVAII